MIVFSLHKICINYLLPAASLSYSWLYDKDPVLFIMDQSISILNFIEIGAEGSTLKVTDRQFFSKS